jgi:nitronate monooxygenase
MSRLGLRHPIIVAPMAGVSTSELVAQVSNVGALGSLAIGPDSPELGRRRITETQSKTSRPFNVNLFCHRTSSHPQLDAAWLDHLRPEFARFDSEPPPHLDEPYDTAWSNVELQQMVLRTSPTVVSFHFGLPDVAFLRALRRAGILTMACVTSPDEARQAARASVDVLVAQGVEAGGHRGCFDPARDSQLTTAALVRRLVRLTNLPVVAAGGIMNGSAIATMLAEGACAVWMGTAFVLCPESGADPAYRAALRRASATPKHRFEGAAESVTVSPTADSDPTDMIATTGVTSAISGRPARGLVNRFHRIGRAYPHRLPGYPRTYAAGKALHQLAAAHQCEDYAAHWAGRGVAQARTLPAADLVEVLTEERLRHQS